MVMILALISLLIYTPCKLKIDMEKHEKIMVTGAQGLVGSNLLEHLAQEGYENIIPVSRLECDLENQAQTLAFIQDHKPDYIYHAAARVYGIIGNIQNRASSFYNNVMINSNVIHGGHLASVKKITVVGTTCIYPHPAPAPLLREDMVFLGQPHESEISYAHAKRAMLAMCQAYEDSHNLNWAYIVSCNLFGDNDTFDTQNGHVVPSLIKKFYDAKQSGGDVHVWGDGTALREFLYVKDMAKVSLDIMRQMKGTVNIGNENIYTIKQIVTMLEEITEIKGNIIWDTDKPNGQAFRQHDISRLKEIDFQPQWSIKQGLQETWDWYCQNTADAKTESKTN